MEFAHKTKNRPTIQSSYTSLGHILKECKEGYNTATCTPMFIAALLKITKLWNYSRCPTTDEWIKKNVVGIHNGVSFSVIKMSEIMSSIDKQEELEIITLMKQARLRRPKATCFL
jgi:hypothetical protein